MPGPDWLPASVRRAGRERTLKPSETLFRAGSRSAGLYEVVRGRVRLVRTDRGGREAVLYVAGPGETLAEASLFSAAYHCDAIATTNTLVRLYPKAALLGAFERDPKAARNFAANLARQVMNLRTRLERNTIRSARDRILHYLSLNAGTDGRVKIPSTFKDLAGELGLTHEAFYRALAALAKARDITRGKGFIAVTRRRAL